MDERKIDFALISSARKPRGEGKTERDRAKKPAAQHSGKRRRDQGKKVNFEPDSAFRNGKSKAGAADGAKSEKKPRKPSDKSRKIAAATRSKRAAKKTDTPAS